LTKSPQNLEAGTVAPVRLVQLTDPHLYGDSARALRGVPTLPALRATIDAAAADIDGCDAILATGDLVQDDPGGYAHFRDVFTALGKPALCIPGNHDLVPEMRAALSGAPFRLDGPVDLGAWRILLLDSTVPGEVGGALATDELQRLEQDLASAPERHALVALHHHPVPMGSRWLDAVGLANAAAFFAVLDRHPQVRGVVYGHVHQHHEVERRGVRILATPSTCSQFLPDAQDFAVDDQPPAWRRLDLHEDGRISTRVRWLGDSIAVEVTAAQAQAQRR
jgi:3',5'-cyclic-AMP phosphodiesterase